LPRPCQVTPARVSQTTGPIAACGKPASRAPDNVRPSLRRADLRV
jgi:hypothetical protein